MFSGNALEHIFHGNINGKGLPSGYHKSNIMSKATILDVSSPDKFSVYRATIEINGKTKFSTFFPESWNRVDVTNAIKEAHEGIKFNKAGWYTGNNSSGMQIKMWLNDRGLVDTAFPIYSK
ncbi:MAG: EndoU domain-containing protein [Cellulosilyticaceae bacterium]